MKCCSHGINNIAGGGGGGGGSGGGAGMVFCHHYQLPPFTQLVEERTMLGHQNCG